MPSRLCLLAISTVANFLLALEPAVAASSCGLSPARAAFDVEGLKSELMVTALSCGKQDRYNDFMARFRPAIGEQERTLERYFTGSYGRNAQKEHDVYITQLANVQSERGLQAGTQFCDQRASMFDEVVALEPADLGGYAEAKDIGQPAGYDVCAALTAVRASSHARGGHARHRH